MEAITLQKRLENSYTGSKNSKAYQIVKDLINGTNKTYMVYGNVIRPCATSGRGRFTSNRDYTKATENLLTLLGIKFKRGNDSPRGGLTGNYFKILTKIDYEKTKTHQQIKAIDAEIGKLQKRLPKEKDMKAFEELRRKIDLLEIKRVQLLYPIEKEQPLPTYKILIK